MEDISVSQSLTCPSCGGQTSAKAVKVTVWTSTGLVAMEDIPAQVCGGCQEEFYDDDASSWMHKLALSGFPRDQVVREISVPVYSFKRNSK